MPAARTISEMRLLNGSTGDPVLFIDYPGKNDALLFDAGDNGSLPLSRLADLEAVFITHHHIDHFVGFDRILRANLDCDKTLHVFGPENTIQKVYDRITSYEHPFFPFQKIVLEVHEVSAGRMRLATLECTRHFPRPQVEERSWNGPVLYENADLRVEACLADHTVPTLAFALVEKTGYHPDAQRLATGALRPGPWVNEALARLRAGEAAETVLEIQGGRFTLGTLGEHYFTVTGGSRIAYVTDTLWSEAVRQGLLKLAQRARRLYCDSYYSQAQMKQAQTHHHMTARQAGELASLARVEELVVMHFAPRYAGRYDALVDEARGQFANVTADLRNSL
jgi:ribonuclease Z